MTREIRHDYETITGEVDSIVFKSEDTGFCVFMLNSNNNLVTVVGELGDVEEGEELTLTGEFTDHAKYGEQFKTVMFERTLPQSSDSILKYLSSGAISGIGPVIAKKLVKAFGEQTLDVIENEPEKLTAIEGITKRKAKKISDDFRSTFAVRSLMSYLSQMGVAVSYGVKAWKRWGDPVLDMIKKNPYLLCSYGVDLPFSKADEMAADMQMPHDSKHRIKAGIEFVLGENAASGHTCLPLDRLTKLAAGFLGVTDQQLSEVIEHELEDENLFKYYKKDRPFIMLREYYKAEDYIARRLCVMRQLTYDNKIDFSAVIDLEEENNNIKYESIQRKAINLALSKGFLVLTGGPGTGKTTTLNAIISLYQQQGMNVMICAPTGRAAKRISDLTGFEAKTIHRLLEVEFTAGDTLRFKHDENDPLDCDALIIDEMSMVDSLLFEAVLRAVSVTCKLVLVGDSDQLPSVGAGNVLKDIIDSGALSVVKLKEIFRQSQSSDIVMNAHKIVNGQPIDYTVKDKDFFFFQRLEYPALQELVVSLCKKRLPDAYGLSPMTDIQVISPTRQGPSGTVELNKIMQRELNPKMAGKSEIKTPVYTYRAGDKVMQTKNDYEIPWKKQIDDESFEKGAGIFNGDIGIIQSVNSILKTAVIDFEGRVAVYTLPMLENLELAYAITVHKSQGSEFEAVIMTVFGGYDRLYYRNLLYTAVTRAKKLMIIVGSSKRVDYMITNDRRNLRYTALKNMLIENVAEDDEVGSV
ncbi:ATP-dependent RecD-like DNA helicase [Ruminococcus sp. FC2018]|uniref:SF1B family DNA helicase RecD2 n=1 Tax=Ruminococcus sp. FC2018 TaxID=1410617 RepID=UPI000569AE75|nr:ATP-dependent RecD-like DNA helicase [Ruminococcus sp. FC2018]